MNQDQNAAELLREQLSALMDGELEGSEKAFLLRRLAHDQELKACWDRYHQIRESLSEPQGPRRSMDFADRVMAAIEAEAAPVVVPQRLGAKLRGGSGWRQVVGGAMAAGVAAIAFWVSSPVTPELTETESSRSNSSSALAANAPTLMPVPLLAPVQRASFGDGGTGGTQLAPLESHYLLQHAAAGVPSAPGTASVYVEWAAQQR
ncbi:MAG: sigma-E factor negative regulatory protein [Xanthomonadales bacterium]|jgi:sigma-E factor negative regulatory protein RseA|nr:sigma-E factor negative regulatory protein [Xanthomonadales bacterium]